MSDSAEDDRIKRKVYLNGFTAGNLMEADLVDYFGLLFGGHVRQVWIDRKFGTHALIEFDDEAWAKKAVERKKHHVTEDDVIVFAWKATKGTFTKRGKKRGLSESTVDDEDEKRSVASSSTCSGWGRQEIDRRPEKSIGSIKELSKSMRMTDEERSRRDKLKEELERWILGVGIWPTGAKLELFGSSVNGFGWRYSDIDLAFLVNDGGQNGSQSCVDHLGISDRSSDQFRISSRSNDRSIAEGRSSPKSPITIESIPDNAAEIRLSIQEYNRIDQKAKLELLASCLREIDTCQISDVVQIHGRRCPVVRFSHRSNQSERWNRCEISIDNDHAIRNTKWLARMNRKYGWLAEIFSVFRWWMGQWRGLEKGRKELNGYTIALIIVAWCQKIGLIDVVDADVDHEGSDFSPAHLDDQSLSAILIQFIATWHSTRWKQTVFTPALRHSDIPVVPLLDFLCSDRYNAHIQFSVINVQDPFDQTHNTASHVSEETVKTLARISEAWTKRVERQGSGDMWKIFDNMDVQIDMDIGNGSDYVFVCEPTADTLLVLARRNELGSGLEKSAPSVNHGDQQRSEANAGIDFERPRSSAEICRSDTIGTEWCKIAVKAILAIFSDVLKLRTAEESIQKFYCLAWNASWLIDRRKIILKNLLEEKEFGIGVQSRYELEKKITEMMVTEEEKGKKKKKKVEPVAEFSLVVELVTEEGFQELKGRLEGEKHVAVFGKFLTEFVPLVFEDAVRKVMGEDF